MTKPDQPTQPTPEDRMWRKKPVVIEAMQFTYPPSEQLLAFCGDALQRVRKARHPTAKAEADIVTLEDGSDGRAKHVATEGDWIIRGVQGEFYPCKPDIFEATYEPASLTAQAAPEEEVLELLGDAALIIRSLQNFIQIRDHYAEGEDRKVSSRALLSKIDALTKPKEARDGEDR